MRAFLSTFSWWALFFASYSLVAKHVEEAIHLFLIKEIEKMNASNCEKKWIKWDCAGTLPRSCLARLAYE